MLIKAPEVLRSGGKATSIKSDVYSLGVLIYALGCGHLPFRTVGQVLDAPPSWRQHYEEAKIGVSESFRQWVGSMLRKDPRRRPTLK